MRLLLDANALLWWRNASRRLSRLARDTIGDGGNEIVLSAATLWEITIKRGLGKLQFPDDLEEVMQEEGFSLMPIAYAHLRTFDNLPRHHRDPFDRLVIAQALSEGIPIATADRIFAAYGVQIVW